MSVTLQPVMNALLIVSINECSLTKAKQAIEGGADIRHIWFERQVTSTRRDGGRKIEQTPMLKLFSSCANLEKIDDKIQIMSLLNAKAVEQCQEALSQTPERLLKPLNAIVAAYRGSDLFQHEKFKLIVNEMANLKAQEGFENRPLLMALREGPDDLINLCGRNTHDLFTYSGESLLTRAIKAKNSELADYLREVGAKE